MRKFKRVGLWTSITCGFLAGIMGFTGPQEIKAAAQGAYLSDVIVITDEDVAKAKNDGYTVMSSPLGEQTLRDQKYGVDHTKTFLAYKTTSKVEDAIRDMKFMNMNGGFDFAKYDEYLDELEVQTKETTGFLFTAIEGYRKYYNAGTPEGKYAYEALNVLRYDEYDGLNNPDSSIEGINMRVGDLFLDEELVPNGDSKILTDIFMESNSTALDAIYAALNIANLYDDDGKNLFTKLEETKDNYDQFIDRADLNNVYIMFSASFDKIREEVNWYNNESAVKYTDFSNTDEALAYSFTLAEDDIINETNFADMWNNASKEIPFLENIEYKGLSGNYENLLDLIMDEEAEADEYYPLMACMTPGVRATAFLGIVDVLTNSMLDRDRYLERLTDLKNADEDSERIVVDEGISVFYGIDREIFQKGNVAMTTSAEEGAIKGDSSWAQQESNRRILDEKTTDILRYASIGLAGIVAGVGVGYILVRGLYSSAMQAAMQASAKAAGDMISAAAKPIISGRIAAYLILESQNHMVTYQRILDTAGGYITKTQFVVPQQVIDRCPLLTDLVNSNTAAVKARLDAEAAFDAAAAKANTAKMMSTIRFIMGIAVAIAVIALVITLVFYILNLLKEEKEVYTKYTDVPGILCHYQNVYEVTDLGTRSMAKDKAYVYYYGATNPYGVANKAKYGNEDDGTLELGENKRNVQDIFNWELGAGKSREWVCLYYTKDIKANYPITTSSLKVLAEVGETLAGASYFNNPNIEYNMTSVLVNNYFDDDIDVNDIKNIQPKYLRFDVNKRGDLKNQRSSVASIVSNPAAWGFILLGLAVGFGGGFLTFHLIDKKKKKANA